MTPEEAIKQLEFDREMILFNPVTGYPIPLEIVKAQNKENYLTYLAYSVGIEALEKQIPKNLKIIYKAKDAIHYNCPCCGLNLMKIENNIQFGHVPMYCEYCGQAIKRE